MSRQMGSFLEHFFCQDMRKNRILVKDGIQEKKKTHLLASTIAEGQRSEHGKEVGVSSEEVPPFSISVDICITLGHFFLFVCLI